MLAHQGKGDGMTRKGRLLRWLLRAGFVLALGLTLFFGARLTLGAVYWSNHRDQPIEGWMPLRYVGRSWSVPPEVIADALGIEPGTLPRRSLSQIARDRDIPEAELIARIIAAIAQARGGQND